HGLKLGSPLVLASANGTVRLVVRGLLSPTGVARAYGGSIAIMDVDGAQVTFGKERRLDRVDLALRPGTDLDAFAAKLQATLGSGYRVERPETRSRAMEQMVSGYQKITSFISLLALLVGAFLVA